MPTVAELGPSAPKSVLTIANLQFIDDPADQRHDEVAVSLELFLRLFPDTNSSAETEVEDRFVLIKFLGAPDYFDSFKIYKVNLINHNAPTHNSITFINDANLVKFNSQLTLTTALVQSISRADIPALEKVFVSVPSEVYKIMKNKTSQSVRDLFVNKLLVSRDSVVSHNDVVRAINGSVVLCEPVSQGFVSESTEIFLINVEQDDSYPKPQPPVTDASSDKDVENINISSYLASTLDFDEPEAVAYPKFRVKTLTDKIFLSNLPVIWSKDDSELFVFINTKSLITLGFPVFNGDSVVLNYGSVRIVVKIFTILEPNNSFDAGFIYISPILSINLKLGPNEEVSIEPHSSKDLQLSNIIPVAKSVTISRVASPITLDKTYQQHFFSALKTSFHSSFKAIRTDDFVPVTIDSIISKTMFDLNEGDEDLSIIPTGDPDSIAWFKIKEITGDDSETGQYVIDPLRTRMILSGVEFIKLVPNKFHEWYEYLGLPPIFNFSEAIKHNPATFAYAKTLEKIIVTNLNSKINLKTSILLNSMSRGLGKTTLLRSLTIEYGINLIELDCIDFINPGSEMKTIGLITGQIEKLLSRGEDEDKSFNIIYLRHVETLCTEVNENEQGSNISTSLSLKVLSVLNDYLNNRSNVIVAMSCNDVDKLNNNIRAMIKFQIDLNVPTEGERLEIFRFLLSNDLGNNSISTVPEFYEDISGFTDHFESSLYPYGLRNDVNFKTLALQSAGLTPRDMISIIKKAKNLAVKRLSTLCTKSQEIERLIKVGNGGLITLIPKDFDTAINDARNQYSDSIGAPRIPNVKWEDIGGLDLVKDEILDTIDMPLKHPELFNNGLKKRSGILFYGPPGTGKTLLAKAIATNFSLNFFSVKGPELLNMYIGESEANVRRVFQRARDAKPCVIFFDELDSVAPKRGNQGDSGGVMDRIVSQLLAELDGMSGGGDGGGDGVFVVGATNRPDLLDEALLRPGRFDKMLYLGISDTNEKQVKILEALTRKFKLDDDVNLNQIAEKCSFTFTGADFYALCSDSMLNAMTRIANEVDSKIKQLNEDLVSQGKEEVSTRWWFDNAARPEDIDVVVKMTDFVKAQAALVPSVSADELDHYLRIRQNFEGSKQKSVEKRKSSTAEIAEPAAPVANGEANGSVDINSPDGNQTIGNLMNGTSNGH